MPSALPTLINSVYAVKKLVFDDEKLDMQHLLDALEHDFVGYEDVQQMCLDAPKYGNDDCEELENLTADLFTFLADYIESFSSHFGHMTSGILPVSGNTPFGLEVGALPVLAVMHSSLLSRRRQRNRRHRRRGNGRGDKECIVYPACTFHARHASQPKVGSIF